MVKNNYLWVVKSYNTKRNLIEDFPQDHLGIGDRLIFNSIIKEQSEFFAKYTGGYSISYPQHIAIIDETKKFGFNPKKLE
jgi:hypothetical protein